MALTKVMNEFTKKFIEDSLKDICYTLDATEEVKMQYLGTTVRAFLDYMDFDLWSYIICNFKFLTPSFIRQFKDELERWQLISFMNEWALIDIIDTDKDFMRQFRKELKWTENFHK